MFLIAKVLVIAYLRNKMPINDIITLSCGYVVNLSKLPHVKREKGFLTCRAVLPEAQIEQLTVVDKWTQHIVRKATNGLIE